MKKYLTSSAPATGGHPFGMTGFGSSSRKEGPGDRIWPAWRSLQEANPRDVTTEFIAATAGIYFNNLLVYTHDEGSPVVGVVYRHLAKSVGQTSLLKLSPPFQRYHRPIRWPKVFSNLDPGTISDYSNHNYQKAIEGLE